MVDNVSAAISPKAAAGLRSRNQYFKRTGTQRPKPIEGEPEGRGWHTCMHACMNARIHDGMDKQDPQYARPGVRACTPSIHAWIRQTNATLCAFRHVCVHAMHARKHACMRGRSRWRLGPKEADRIHAFTHARMHACREAWTSIANATICASRHARMHAMRACMRGQGQQTQQYAHPSKRACTPCMHACMPCTHWPGHRQPEGKRCSRFSPCCTCCAQRKVGLAFCWEIQKFATSCAAVS